MTFFVSFILLAGEISLFFEIIFDHFCLFSTQLDEIISALHEYHTRMCKLESDKFENEYEVARKDYEAR